jgi:hypothetical protein
MDPTHYSTMHLSCLSLARVARTHNCYTERERQVDRQTDTRTLSVPKGNALAAKRRKGRVQWAE